MQAYYIVAIVISVLLCCLMCCCCSGNGAKIIQHITYKHGNNEPAVGIAVFSNATTTTTATAPFAL